MKSAIRDSQVANEGIRDSLASHHGLLANRTGRPIILIIAVFRRENVVETPGAEEMTAFERKRLLDHSKANSTLEILGECQSSERR